MQKTMVVRLGYWLSKLKLLKLELKEQEINKHYIAYNVMIKNNFSFYYYAAKVELSFLICQTAFNQLVLLSYFL